MEINIMAIDATFWVAVSFIIFFGALIYLKIPQKITEMLDKMISDIKNEIDESEKLRTDAKTLFFTSLRTGSPGACGGRAPRARGRMHTLFSSSGYGI